MEGDEESTSRFHFARSPWDSSLGFVYLKRIGRNLRIHRGHVDDEYAVYPALAVHLQRPRKEILFVQLHNQVIQLAAKSVRPRNQLHLVIATLLLHGDGEVFFQV